MKSNAFSGGDYYSAMASNQPYNGYVGQTDYYETYV